MYKVSETTDKDNVVKEATTPPPFGGGFPKETAEKADRLEVWGSSFNDAGDDFCEFRLFKGEEQIATRRVGGY